MQRNNSLAEAEKLKSRHIIKSCARHSFRDYKMKNFIITTVMALLIGGFAFTANAQDKTKTVVKKGAKTEKHVKVKKNNSDLELDVNRGSTKGQNDPEQQAIQENNDLLNEFVKTVDNCEQEHNNKHKGNNQFSQYLEKALRLSKKINKKLLTDSQKTTFETSKAKLNGLLKR